VADPRQQSGVVDLVPVQMQDRQYGSVTNRIEELIDVLGSCQGSRFRFTIPHHRRNDQAWIVKSGTAGMR